MTTALERSRAREALLVEAERILGPLATWDNYVTMAYAKIDRLRDIGTLKALAFLLAQMEARDSLTAGERRRMATLDRKEAKEGLTQEEQAEMVVLMAKVSPLK